jgi:hypothetical protein
MSPQNPQPEVKRSSAKGPRETGTVPSTAPFNVGLAFAIVLFGIALYLFARGGTLSAPWLSDVRSLLLVLSGGLVVLPLQQFLRISLSRRGHRPTFVLLGSTTILLTVVLLGTATFVSDRVLDLSLDPAAQLSPDETPAPFEISSVEGWGDSTGGRRGRSYLGDGTSGAEVAAFNSFVADDIPGVLSPSGSDDERNFVHVTMSTDVWGGWTDELHVEPGDLITVAVYVHNNADPSTNGQDFAGPGVSLGTKAMVRLPEPGSNRIVVRGWIVSDNAEADWITDSVTLVSDIPIQLEPAAIGAQRYTSTLDAGFLDNRAGIPNEIYTASGIPLEHEVDGLAVGFPGCWDYRTYLLLPLVVERWDSSTGN